MLNHPMERLLNDAVQVFTEQGLRERLAGGRRLTVKLGADPSRPDLHLGHTVILRQLKRFQELGHAVVFVIGDFTAMIGDPTGRSKTRPPLTLEEARASGESYFRQVSKVLDPALTTIRYNSEWLGALRFAEIIALASRHTLARMLERDDFARRYREEQAIHLHELLYPLAQGYDSVAIKADIEIGGTEQTFNLLVGREMQRNCGQMPQEVVTFPLLAGLDGREKMSKSLDNYIGIDEPPGIMYEKAMHIPDGLLPEYYALTSDIPPEEAARLLEGDIVAAHARYAEEIVRMYHGPDAVAGAGERYAAVAAGGIPEAMPCFALPAGALDGGSIGICDLLRMAGLVSSNSEARRLIAGGGIKLDNAVVSDPAMRVSSPGGRVLSRGKSRFCRINLQE